MAFDVAEEGDYWFFARGTADRDRAHVRLSIDDAPFQTTLLTLWPTHAAWTSLRPGKTVYSAAGGLEPFHLEPGRHTLRLLPHKGPATLLDFAVSDDPLPFEPK